MALQANTISGVPHETLRSLIEEFESEARELLAIGITGASDTEDAARAPHLDRQLDLAEAIFQYRCLSAGDVREKCNFLLSRPDVLEWAGQWTHGVAWLLRSFVDACGDQEPPTVEDGNLQAKVKKAAFTTPDYGSSSLHLYLGENHVGEISPVTVSLINTHKNAVSEYLAAVTALDLPNGDLGTQRQEITLDEAHEDEVVSAVACAYCHATLLGPDSLAIDRHINELKKDSGTLASLIELPTMLTNILGEALLEDVEIAAIKSVKRAKETKATAAFGLCKPQL